MAEKLSERLERIVRAPGLANNPAYADAIREAAELARRVEGAPSVMANEWIWEDVPTELEGQRVRLVPEPPEVG